MKEAYSLSHLLSPHLPTFLSEPLNHRNIAVICHLSSAFPRLWMTLGAWEMYPVRCKQSFEAEPNSHPWWKGCRGKLRTVASRQLTQGHQARDQPR